MAEKTIKIKLVKSAFGRKPNQAKTLKALGLSKINQVVERTDNDCVRGMVATVKHLVEVVEQEVPFMLNLSELKPNNGAKHYKKIVGRGTSSGTGKTSGKGHKGQNARSGGGVRPGFEGGQTPLFKRLPKRGFTNVNRKEYAIVNVEDLNVFKEGTVVTVEKLQKEGLVKKVYDGLKVLGNGKLEVSLTVKANKFSKSALQAINDAGGKAEVI